MPKSESSGIVVIRTNLASDKDGKWDRASNTTSWVPVRDQVSIRSAGKAVCNGRGTHLGRDAFVTNHADPPTIKLKNEDGTRIRHGSLGRKMQPDEEIDQHKMGSRGTWIGKTMPRSLHLGLLPLEALRPEA